MSDATSTVSSIDPLGAVLEVLSDPTAVLFGLEAEFSVSSISRIDPSTVRVIVRQTVQCV